ncbi:hypothetical protein BST23_25325 [Mycolicibacterium elephantis]|uniref:Uncharacterized protein n=1 Tax=Mycolicibacterium elephantis TaxID=81858 RepID=A0A1X0CEZ2_9MYCO|nr:hypothetical protein [Mycolicibacterium elephantis]ORA58703.1 hypothetical protein BST23_25325 [Mycolicibacterium elephantis]
MDEIDTTAEANGFYERLCATDAILERLASSRWAQAVGSEIDEQYAETAAVLGKLRVDADPSPVQTRWVRRPEYGKFYVFTDNRNTKAGHQHLSRPIPIATLGEYRRVVEHHLDPDVKGCQLSVSIFCRPSLHNRLFALKRGEKIYVAKACGVCMQLFDLPDPDVYAARPVGPACSYGKSGGQYPEPLITRPEPIIWRDALADDDPFDFDLPPNDYDPFDR